MIVELRQYTLKDGRRDDLIELFERSYVEAQEAAGIELLGQFRDCDDANRFVWLRAFPDMDARAASLGAFYGGDVWRATRNAANDTMIDSDNVLLLRAREAPATWRLHDRIAADASMPAAGTIVASIQSMHAASIAAYTAYFDTMIRPRIAAAGAEFRGSFVTEAVPNTFPALPVRDGENVFVWLARIDGDAGYDALRRSLRAAPDARASASPEVLAAVARRPEVLLLKPAARSRLR